MTIRHSIALSNNELQAAIDALDILIRTTEAPGAARSAREQIHNLLWVLATGRTT